MSPSSGDQFFFAFCERFTSFSILQSCTQKRRVASQRDLSPSSSGCCCRCLQLVVVVALINEEMFVDRALFFITAAAAGAVAVCGGEKKNSYELLQQTKPTNQPTNRIGLLISPARRRRLSVRLWSGTSSNSLAAASHHYCIAGAAVAVA